MLNIEELKRFAPSHTVRECCDRFSTSYFTMYHYLRDHNIQFIKNDNRGEHNSNYKHGGRHTRIYHIWLDLRQRCNNPKNHAYSNYGGRGIKVCEEWNNSFTSFLSWSEKNGYNNTLSIDRIDVDSDYSPDNCRWVNRKIQNINKRNNRRITYKGRTKTMKEWAEQYNMNYDKLRYRLDNWEDLDKVFGK